DLDFELFVDQLLDHVLPRRRLMVGQRVEFRALLDVVVGNDFAIDNQDDMLGERVGWRCYCCEDAACHNDDAVAPASLSAADRGQALSSLLNVASEDVTDNGTPRMHPSGRR